jgi:hypothetical protein
VTAAATERQAASANDQTSIGWLNFGGNVVTALVAGLAAVFAWMAADAARKNLAHDKRTARAQLRPWLSFDGLDAGRVEGAVTADKKQRFPYAISAQIRFINTGLSPALKVRMRSAHQLTDFATYVAPDFSHKSGNAVDGGTQPASFGPQRRAYALRAVFVGAEYEAIMSHKKCFWLYTRAEYEEPGHTGELYVTEVTLRVWHDSDVIGRDGKLHPSFNSAQIGVLNDMK